MNEIIKARKEYDDGEMSYKDYLDAIKDAYNSTTDQEERERIITEYANAIQINDGLN